jgi:hypothetical protein
VLFVELRASLRESRRETQRYSTEKLLHTCSVQKGQKGHKGYINDVLAHRFQLCLSTGTFLDPVKRHLARIAFSLVAVAGAVVVAAVQPLGADADAGVGRGNGGRARHAAVLLGAEAD